jgi:hypothetical protein
MFQPNLRHFRGGIGVRRLHLDGLHQFTALR